MTWLLLGAAIVLLSTVAGGWWSTGTGLGSPATPTTETLTIIPAAGPTPPLYPGASGALQLSVRNPHLYPVRLTSVTYGTVTSSNEHDCPASNLTVAADGPLATPVPVPANDSSRIVSLPAAVTLSNAAPDACQGVTFTVPITLSSRQT